MYAIYLDILIKTKYKIYYATELATSLLIVIYSHPTAFDHFV
jgi:hypothetical protein